MLPAGIIQKIVSYGEANGLGCVTGIYPQTIRLTTALTVSYTHLDVYKRQGGDSTGLQGSIVQKYDYYGTRLEAGTYRVVLEMKTKDGTPHYLAAEFDVE